MKNRLTVFEHSIIGKATVTENIGCPVKSIGNFIRGVGVCTDGNDFAAKFTITADYIHTWIWFSKTVVITSGIQFNSDVFADQCTQNFIQDFLIAAIGVLTGP